MGWGGAGTGYEISGIGTWYEISIESIRSEKSIRVEKFGVQPEKDREQVSGTRQSTHFFPSEEERVPPEEN